MRGAPSVPWRGPRTDSTARADCLLEIEQPFYTVRMAEDVATAWDAVHAALDRLPGWEVMRPVWYSEERRWVASGVLRGAPAAALGGHPGSSRAG